jgi:alpha-L-glutamate ligase-like protein
MWGMIDRLTRDGVLGMNRRNAEYIMRWNPRSLFPLVDNKIITKRLAHRHQIPTPDLYAVVENHGALAGIKKLLQGYGEFVVKPARGSGGSGILLITGQNSGGVVTQSGEKISFDELTYRISDILSGINSLGGLEDQALVEALVHPDPVFASVTYQGVPDVRIVTYRGVPVMAMVRLPTRASDGKANLHRGAIGAGVELGKGVTLSAVHHSRVVSAHPDTGRPVVGLQVPHWEKVLWMAAKAWDMTGLGYIGVDVVIDRERGPLLLELNARPGLAIQIANRVGLWQRLQRIEEMAKENLASPETRVAFAREAFGAPG